MAISSPAAAFASPKSVASVIAAHVQWGRTWNLGLNGFAPDPAWASVNALNIITLEALS